MPMTLRLVQPGFIYAGAHFHFNFYLDSPDGRYGLIRTIVPDGAAVYYNCGKTDCAIRPDGRFTKYFQDGKVATLARIEGLERGTQTIVVEAEHGDTHEIVRETMTLEVEPLEAPARPPKPASVAKWEAAMLKWGPVYCKPAENYGAFGWDGSITFYDGAYVNFQIADYTGQQLYLDTAWNIASQWADYVISKNGATPGWRVFTDGLRVAWERSKQQKYIDAIYVLADKSPVASTRTLDDTYMRETAYSIEAFVNAELVGRERDSRLVRNVDLLIAQIDISIRTESPQQPVSLQHFMLGLASDALIKYYKLTADARIPPTIYRFLRWSKTTGWNPTTNKMVWQLPPNYKEDTTLINLVAHAFAWYARHAIDTEMRDHADLMFAHALDELPWGGKMFSQMYQKSFRFVADQYGIKTQRDDERGFPQVEWVPDYPPPVPPPPGTEPEDTDGY